MFQTTRRKLNSQHFIFTFTLVLAFLSLLLQSTSASALPVQPHFNHFFLTHPEDGTDDNGNDQGYGPGTSPGTSSADVLAQQQYADTAYPNSTVGYDQTIAAYNAFRGVMGNAAKWNDESWQLVGPTVGNAAPQATYTGKPTTNSGRVTALLVSKNCTQAFCPVWLGAAGGGVWVTFNGLAAQPTWHSDSYGLASNAIGSLYQDPTDPTGRTIYVGTGEPNGSSDSEAGVGLYKSTDFGLTWKIVAGSIPAAKERSIASIAIDPKTKDLYIGTALARHGASAVNGGRWTPPDAPKIGLYESTDGGKTFSLIFAKDSDTPNPASPNGSDYFRGGVSKILIDRTGLVANLPSRVYFSMFDYGLYRKTENDAFEQVFASAGGGLPANSLGSRTEFALAPMGNKLRIYVGDTDGTTSDLFRTDNANVPASTLTDGTNNPGWIALSNPTQGTPGYTSYNFCETQCSYDMVVVSPPGHPDTVWLGGSMNYNEIFTPNPPSNGRAVQRSTDGGVTFTDMTDDNENPPLGMHPDQHAIAFSPTNPDITFDGSDGGVVRTDGQFVDASSQCATRGLDAAGLAECQISLKAIPTHITSLNAGLATLQFQSVTVNPKAPTTDLIGGTQDNGSWAFNGQHDNGTSSLETVGGDGGQSAIDYANPNIRFHMYYNPNGDVNFNGNDPAGWDYDTQPMVNSGEASSFYIPLIADPAIGGTVFGGLEHVWRTQDDGGNQAYLDVHCNEYTGLFDNINNCGDWVPIGQNLADTTFGTDKTTTASGGSYVVAIGRTPSDKNTLWAATRLGRLFISTNANAAAASVSFTRLDTAAQPSRFISGIAVDPKNPNHAVVTFSGYNAYTPSTPGHVFDVTYNPATGKATWVDISHNLGDAPVTGVAYDAHRGDLYISTDFGVAVLDRGSNRWHPAAPGLPTVATYSLTMDPTYHVLYAATHGRSVWKLKLEGQ
jgi:hypothetical protein